MRVALITEGTYPIHQGGVSNWCDQLIRGLPDVTFDVVALSGAGREAVTYELPGNVESLQRFGLWAPASRVRISRTTMQRFTTAYEQFVESLLSEDSSAPTDFLDAVQSLSQLAGERRLRQAMRSEVSVAVLLSAWKRHTKRNSSWDGAGSITLADVLAVTDLIEHYLRSLELSPLDVDLVHATANGPCAVVGLMSKWANGTPLVITEHGVYLRERMLALRASATSRALREITIRFYVRLTELGYRNADAILPVSDFNGRWARRNGAPPTAVRTTYNGVAEKDFRLIEDEPVVPTLTFVGRIDPLKDLRTLILAFALVRDRVCDAKLKLFGPVPPGNESYADACKTLVTELGLDGSATFEGPVSPARRAFEAGHVVVLSSMSEGLPLSVIEAAMSGRAVVATDVGGMSEAVGDGGLIVATGDYRALADACTQLLIDHALRHRLAAAGRARAVELFTVDRFVSDFGKLYEEMAQTKAEVELPEVTPGAEPMLAEA